MKTKKHIPAMLIALVAATSNFAAAEFHKDNDFHAKAIELAIARSTVKEKCQDCYEIETTVSKLLNDSCHIEQSWSQSKEIMLHNAMYAYLLGLKSLGVYGNVFEIVLKSAQNSVDCESDVNWVKKTKDLSVYFLM